MSRVARRAVVQDGTVVTLPADSPLRGGWQRALQESSYLFNCLSYVVNRWQLDRRLRRAHEQAVVLAAAAEVEYKKKTESQPAANTVEAPTPAAAAVENKPAEPDHMPSVVDTPVSLPGDAAAQIVVTRHFLAAWKRDCDSRQARFIVAYVPGVAELEEGGNAAMAVSERALRQAFFSCVDSLEIDVIDLLPEMLSAKQSAGIDQLLIPSDGHWNAAGHAIVARSVAWRLADATTARR